MKKRPESKSSYRTSSIGWTTKGANLDHLARSLAAGPIAEQR